MDWADEVYLEAMSENSVRNSEAQEGKNCPFSPRLHQVLAVFSLVFSSCGEDRVADMFELDPGTPVVVIVIDTLRADHLSCYGYPLETSPFLDKFAARSFKFEANSTQCNATFPSMMSIFTGVYPKTHRNYLAVPIEGTTVESKGIVPAADRFGTQGYYTVAVTSHPTWASSRDQSAALWSGWDEISYLGEPIPLTDRPLFARHEFTNERLFDLLDDYDRKHASQPLFLWAHYFDPHTDFFGNLYDPPEETRNAYFDYHYRDVGVEGFADLLRPLDPEARNAWIQEHTPRELRKALKLATGRAGYDEEILSTDKGISDLFERLEISGLLDEAVIVVMSDHGENMEEHSETRQAHPFTHTRLYDGVVHTPLLIHLPGQMEGLEIASITQNIDVLPTLMELLDHPESGRIDGVSLVPLMRGTTENVHSTVFIESSWGREKSIRSDDLKLIDGWLPNEREVYDWRSDSGELENLSNSFSEEEPADLIEALEDFRPDVELHIRMVPMERPYLVEFRIEMEGVRIEGVEGVVDGSLSEAGESFAWGGTVGPEGVEITLHPKIYKSGHEVCWTFRHSERKDLHNAVWLGKTPVSKTPAVPLWQADEGVLPKDPKYTINEDLEANSTRIELDHVGAERIECEVRYRSPRHDKVIRIDQAQGFGERFPPREQFLRADAYDVDRSSLEIHFSEAEASPLYLLRIDGAWPEPSALMFNGHGVITDTLRFIFPSLPKDKRISPYLGATLPANVEIPPGTIVVWQESGLEGGEVDAGGISKELAKQLNSIGYLGDSSSQED
ncbi:MAG: arylsulfatase [Planctomycetota bacterium]